MLLACLLIGIFCISAYAEQTELFSIKPEKGIKSAFASNSKMGLMDEALFLEGEEAYAASWGITKGYFKDIESVSFSFAENKEISLKDCETAYFNIYIAVWEPKHGITPYDPAPSFETIEIVCGDKSYDLPVEITKGVLFAHTAEYEGPVYLCSAKLTDVLPKDSVITNFSYTPYGESFPEGYSSGARLKVVGIEVVAGEPEPEVTEPVATSAPETTAAPETSANVGETTAQTGGADNAEASSLPVVIAGVVGAVVIAVAAVLIFGIKKK